MLAMWYNVNWDRLTLLLLPTFLRKPVLFGYIKALISPIAHLHDEWQLEREENLKILSYNSQKCSLRKALNDKSDNDSRRIYLDKVPPTQNVYIYTKNEYLDLYLDTIYIDLDYTAGGETVNGVVYVPLEFKDTNKMHEITATLEFYKLATISYKIQYYE